MPLFGPGRPMSLRDRGWLPVTTVRVIGPLAGLSASGLREALVRLHAGHPRYRAVCRVDARRSRWVPLSGTGFAARLPDMVVELPDRPGTGVDELALELSGLPLGDLPVRFAVSGPYVGMQLTHALGDGRVSGTLLPEVVGAAATGRPPRPPLPHPTRLPLARALLRHFGRHPQRLLMARITRPPVVGAPAGEVTVDWHPQVALCSARSAPGLVPALHAWRAAHLPHASLAAILFAAITAALDRVGLGTDRPGVVILIDARRYLRPPGIVAGNFACGQYVRPGPPGDPRTLDRALNLDHALKRELASGRALVTLLLRDAHFLLAPGHAATPRHTVVRGTPRPELTLTHLGRLDALADLPWDAPIEARRALSTITPGGPEAITVSIGEMFGALHLAATFHASTFGPATVRRALALVCEDPAALVTSAVETTGETRESFSP